MLPSYPTPQSRNSYLIAASESRCPDCPLRPSWYSGIRPVLPSGPLSSPVMLVGEAPGEQEQKFGIPFYPDAPSGREVDNLLVRIGLHRSRVYIDNLLHCHPPGDRDPKPAEIECCRSWLLSNIARSSAQFIITLGRFSTRALLGDVDMEAVHGIPHLYKVPSQPHRSIWVIPCYHPAAGLRSPETMIKVMWDFQQAKRAISHPELLREPHDPYAGKEVYQDYRSGMPITILYSGTRVAVDTETEDGRFYCATFSVRPGEAYKVNYDNRPGLELLRNLVQDPRVITLTHNYIFDGPILEQKGIIPCNLRDTMTEAYLLQIEPLGLKPLAYRHCGMIMRDYDSLVAEPRNRYARAYLEAALTSSWPDPDKIPELRPDGSVHLKQPQNIAKKISKFMAKHPDDLRSRWLKIKLEEGRSQIEDILGPMPDATVRDVPPDDLLFYACRDADATLRVDDALTPIIDFFNLDSVLSDDSAILPMCADMEQSGIPVNLPVIKELSAYFGARAEEVQDGIRRLVNRPGLNVGSPDQLADLLFNHLRLPVLKKTKGGPKSPPKPSTDEREVLSKLKNKHPVVPLILEYRQYSKLKGTYADAIPKLVSPDGRLRAQVHTTVASTGRITFTKPNMQGQPTRTAEGKMIRMAYHASPGCTLVSADYSQIELRALAEESQDPNMISVFQRDEDIHSFTGRKMFHVPDDQPVDEMKHRYPAKRTNFGIPYGIDEHGLLRDFIYAGATDWTLEKVRLFLKDWFDLFPGVQKYIARSKEHLRLHGYARDMWGRIRWIAGTKTTSRQLQAEAERQAVNHGIQAGAQGVIKKAMIALTPIYKAFRAMGYVCNPLIQIHDDLVFEVQDEILDAWCIVMKDVMEHVVTWRIKTPVDLKVGKIWGDLKRYGK